MRGLLLGADEEDQDYILKQRSTSMLDGVSGISEVIRRERSVGQALCIDVLANKRRRMVLRFQENKHLLRTTIDEASVSILYQTGKYSLRME